MLDGTHKLPHVSSKKDWHIPDFWTNLIYNNDGSRIGSFSLAQEISHFRFRFRLVWQHQMQLKWWSIDIVWPAFSNKGGEGKEEKDAWDILLLF